MKERSNLETTISIGGFGKVSIMRGPTSGTITFVTEAIASGSGYYVALNKAEILDLIRLLFEARCELVDAEKEDAELA